MSHLGQETKHVDQIHIPNLQSGILLTTRHKILAAHTKQIIDDVVIEEIEVKIDQGKCQD